MHDAFHLHPGAMVAGAFSWLVVNVASVPGMSAAQGEIVASCIGGTCVIVAALISRKKKGPGGEQR